MYIFCYINISIRSRASEGHRGRQENYGLILAFDVNEFFSFGSPLSLILAYRRMLSGSGNQSIVLCLRMNKLLFFY
jgi:hypothetical protein